MRLIKRELSRLVKKFYAKEVRTATTIYMWGYNLNKNLWSENAEEKTESMKKMRNFAIFCTLCTTIYILKRQKGTQVSLQVLFEAIRSEKVTEIRVIKSDEDQEYRQALEEQSQKGHGRPLHFIRIQAYIDHDLSFAITNDATVFEEKCRQLPNFARLKIFQEVKSPIDLKVKRVNDSILRVIMPLIFPYLLYKSSAGIMFKSKKIGELSGVKTNILFKDVAGLGEAKLQISELVDFLKHPAKYKRIGAKIPKGALLTGPPGTGKTLLAKACAGEAGVPFFTVSASEFVELFAGMGASKVRDLFKNARKQTPSIVFIDEIDAIGRKREDKFGAGHDERANTLNQLLVEMDGFDTSSDVIVLAATNRKDMLDSALTRPGRFDRMVEIDLPDIKGRQQILEIYLRKINLSPQFTLKQFSKKIAALTFGFSGADLANLCNEAAIMAVRAKQQYVLPSNFQSASERVLAGLQSHIPLGKEEKRRVAYHEAGHAVVSWFLEGAAPLIKVTIIPRSKGSLGFAQYLPSEAALQTEIELKEQICVMLGGRMAEEHFFGSGSTGASDDLKKVRRLTRMIIVDFGMSSLLPNYAPSRTDGENIYAEGTATIIDEEIQKLIRTATSDTREMIRIHADKLTALAERLVEKETITHGEVKEILGERPFPARDNYREFLQQSETLQPKTG